MMLPVPDLFPLVTLMSIPSPSEGVWHLGPVPIRGYALCIIAGIVLAIWIGERRWVARGGKPGEVSDLAIWAVPFGLVGGRLYHVITDWQLYFGEDQNPVTALYVWRGGLGIWGAIALGAVGVWIGARRARHQAPAVLDAMAPGVLVAQAMGRWGNWFNQALYGRPTDLPWGLEIDPGIGDGVRSQFGADVLFHPTFLYECLWNLAAFALLIWLDRRYRLGHGRVVALYVMLYTAGRGWIEYLRIDTVQMDDVLGLRLNVWTSIVLFVLAAAFYPWSARRHPGREEVVRPASPTRTGTTRPTRRGGRVRGRSRQQESRSHGLKRRSPATFAGDRFRVARANVVPSGTAHHLACSRPPVRIRCAGDDDGRTSVPDTRVPAWLPCSAGALRPAPREGRLRRRDGGHADRRGEPRHRRQGAHGAPQPRPPRRGRRRGQLGRRRGHPAPGPRRVPARGRRLRPPERTGVRRRHRVPPG